MRTRNPLLSLASCLLGLGLFGCDDSTTGQLPEPGGPLQVTRLTLLDAVSRDNPVFTDTSLPDCDKPENQELPVCKNDVLRDRYSPHKSPPTPDGLMRAVFNKAPLLFAGSPIEEMGGIVADSRTIDLGCGAPCTGVPPLLKGLDVTGSSLSYDPTVVPYGPALWQQPDAARDPKAALEPDTDYQVKVSPQLSGRDGQGITLDDRSSGLLRFRTEPFRVLQAGNGDSAGDPYVYASDMAGAGTKDSPYKVAGLALDGVLALKLNAPVDDETLAKAAVSAQVGGRAVPVKLGFNRIMRDPVTMGVRCDLQRYRVVYLYPAAGTWGTAADKDVSVSVTLAMGTLRDVSQAPGHPAGRHTLSDVVLSAALSGKLVKDDKTYHGPSSADVSGTAACPGH